MNEQLVLLTGATGFIGPYVLRQLLERGHRVRCLIRPGGGWRLPRSEVERGTVEPCHGNVLRADDCLRAAEGCDAVVHLVGIIRERGPNTFQQVHVEATRHIVQACLRGGATRLVHMSSLGASATSAADYHRTKAAAETLVTESPLRWTIFRPAMVLGRESPFLRQMVGLVKPCWRPVPVIGDGKYIVQPLGVEDLARLLGRSLELAASERKIYELGGPSPMTLDEFTDILSRAACGRLRTKYYVPLGVVRSMAGLAERLLANPPITSQELAMLGEARPADLAAARRDFAWQPEPLADCLQRYLK